MTDDQSHPEQVLIDVLRESPEGLKTPKDFVRRLLEKGLTHSRAIALLQTEIAKRKLIGSEILRFQSFESPDEETLKQMEQFLAEQQDWHPDQEE